MAMEPFLATITDPERGLDLGFNLAFKYYFGKEPRQGWFTALGAGAAYTAVKFTEQGTHLFGILQGSIGYRWKKFHVANRFRHYSNGNTAGPNRSINANILNIGINF
jgi:hypothetical protein